VIDPANKETVAICIAGGLFSHLAGASEFQRKRSADRSS